jgi:hypothetical protein
MGLDYAGVAAAADLMGLVDRARAFDGVAVLERELLRVIEEKRPSDG